MFSMGTHAWRLLFAMCLTLTCCVFASKLNPDDFDYYREADVPIPSGTLVLNGFAEVVEGLPVSALFAAGGADDNGDTIMPVSPSSPSNSNSSSDPIINIDDGVGTNMYLLANATAISGSSGLIRFHLDFSKYLDGSSPSFPGRFLKSDDVLVIEGMVGGTELLRVLTVYAVGLVSRPAGVEDTVSPVYSQQPATSTLKVLWVMMNFADANSVCSRTQMDSMIFSGSTNVVNLYNQASNGRRLVERQSNYMSYHVAGPFNFPQFNTGQDCNAYVYNWQSAAAAAAAAAGYNLSKYGSLAMVVPRIPSCYWAGLGSYSQYCNPSGTSTSTAPRCFVALTYCLPFAFTHELGHNMYMHHSASDPSDGVTYSSSAEYSDWSCAMGNQNSFNSFNGAKYYQQRWLDSEKVVVDSPGVYRLSPTDMLSSSSPYPQLLMFNVPSLSKHYYLTFRLHQNQGQWLSSKYYGKLNIHYTVDSSPVSRFVTSLSSGGTWLLAGINWRVTVLSVSSTDITVQVLPCDSTTSCSSYAWATADWSACSKSCGSGIRTRSVTCVDSSKTSVSAGFCANSGVVPASSESCNTQTCSLPSWQTDATWGSCSKTCGGGVQTRAVRCVLNGVVQADSSCPAASKPTTSQQCNTGPCYNWLTSSYSACSVVCGTGVQTRSVFCASTASSSTAVADTFCSGTRPVSSTSCNAGACSYAWSTGAWSSCSASCNGGTSTRSVQCKLQTGTVVADSYCSASSSKPLTSSSCNTAACCPVDRWGSDCQRRKLNVVLGPIVGIAYSQVQNDPDTFTRQFLIDIASALNMNVDRFLMNGVQSSSSGLMVSFGITANYEWQYNTVTVPSILPDATLPVSFNDLLGFYQQLLAQSRDRNSYLYRGAITSKLLFNAVGAPSDPDGSSPSPDTPSTPSSGDGAASDSHVGLAVGLSIGGAALIAVAVAAGVWYRKNRSPSSRNASPATELTGLAV